MKVTDKVSRLEALFGGFFQSLFLIVVVDDPSAICERRQDTNVRLAVGTYR